MAESESSIIRGTNIYESRLTRGLHEALDFYVEAETAAIPLDYDVKNHDRYGILGKPYGNVVPIALGLQTVSGQDGELTDMTLLASPGIESPLHHIVFHHGEPKKLEREAVIGIVQQCPGMLFDLDCGCSECRDKAVQNVFNSDAEAAVLMSYDWETPPEERIPLARNMLEAIGVKEPNFFVTPEVVEDCDLRKRMRNERFIHEFTIVGDDAFVQTHDMQVKFRDGTPARLMVYEELPKAEKRGYGQKTKLHYVLTYGDLNDPNITPIARYHSSCVTAEHGGNACDCHLQLTKTLHDIKEHGAGIIIHADEEGMRLGGVAKFEQTLLTLTGSSDLLKAREQHLAIPGDTRNYGLIEAVARKLKLTKIVMQSNNKDKKRGWEKHGVEVVSTNHIHVDYNLLAQQAQADVKAKIKSGRYHDYTPVQ